jgi:ribosomal protein S18 acetylase RimI-like enzyme
LPIGADRVNEQPQIRPAVDNDTAAIRTIAVATGLFAADELEGFDERLTGYLDGTLAEDAWLVLESGTGEVVGAAYYAPEPFSDRVWNLFFIGVMPDDQGGGAGGALIRHIETALREKGEDHARVLIVETSGLDNFTLTREFYAKHGYDEEAHIRQFYGPDDDKVTFWKSLVG